MQKKREVPHKYTSLKLILLGTMWLLVDIQTLVRYVVACERLTSFNRYISNGVFGARKC